MEFFDYEGRFRLPEALSIKDERLRDISSLHTRARFVAFDQGQDALKGTEVYIATHMAHMKIVQDVLADKPLTPIASGFVDIDLPEGVTVNIMPPVYMSTSACAYVREGLKKLGIDDALDVSAPVLDTFHVAFSTPDKDIYVKEFRKGN